MPAIRLAKKLIELAPKSRQQGVLLDRRLRGERVRAQGWRASTRRRRDIAYLENGYHGLTLGSLEVTASEKYRESAGKPMGSENYAIPTAYCYRCKFGPHTRVQRRSASTASRQMFDARPNTAAIIAEPIQAVGGLAPPQKWWDRLDEIRKKRGILLIADEVQTGLGRTGKMFAVEHYGLAARDHDRRQGPLGRRRLARADDRVRRGQQDVLRRHHADVGRQRGVGGRRPRADRDRSRTRSSSRTPRTMGRYFTEAAWALKDPWIGDVRFTGLLGGIELVKNRESREVLGKTEMAKIKDVLHDAGMLITVSGLHGNVLRLQPPLSFTTRADRSVRRRAAQGAADRPWQLNPAFVSLDSDRVRRRMNLFAFRKHLDQVLHPLVSALAKLPLHANTWTMLGALIGPGRRRRVLLRLLVGRASCCCSSAASSITSTATRRATSTSARRSAR